MGVKVGNPDVMHRYITEAGRLWCNKVPHFRPSRGDVLMMHMRSGDVLNMLAHSFGYHRMPPCQFFIRAFHYGNYSSARIITEPDQGHPCINEVKQALQGRVSVQSKSELEDFCTMIYARSLVVSHSTLATAIVELSTTLRT